ncbi:MAG: ATP-binding protein [bacterium]
MRSISEIKAGHENACTEFVKVHDYARAAVEAARAAEYGFALAGRTSGSVAEAHTQDADGWVALAEELKKRKSEVRSRKSEVGGNAGEQKGDAEATDGDEWLVAEKPDVTFEDICGMAEAKRVIHEMVVYPMSSPEKARALGLNAGGGVLVYGPPGIGKTMLGKAVAGVLQCPFYYASGAQLRSKWYGESEQRLNRLIRTAQEQPMAVLFLDEVEALLPKRDDGTSGADNRLVTQFLADVGGFRETKNILLILGATNKPWEIDEAVFRSGRFDEKIYIGPPDYEARLGILKKHIGIATCAADVNREALAESLEGFSGSDVAGIVHAAKRLALGRAVVSESDPVIIAEDFENARQRIPSSITSEMLADFEKFKHQRFG